jgi:hypothetical protein
MLMGLGQMEVSWDVRELFPGASFLVPVFLIVAILLVAVPKLRRKVFGR